MKAQGNKIVPNLFSVRLHLDGNLNLGVEIVEGIVPQLINGRRCISAIGKPQPGSPPYPLPEDVLVDEDERLRKVALHSVGRRYEFVATQNRYNTGEVLVQMDVTFDSSKFSSFGGTPHLGGFLLMSASHGKGVKNDLVLMERQTIYYVAFHFKAGEGLEDDFLEYVLFLEHGAPKILSVEQYLSIHLRGKQIPSFMLYLHGEGKEIEFEHNGATIRGVVDNDAEWPKRDVPEANLPLIRLTRKVNVDDITLNEGCIYPVPDETLVTIVGS